MRGGCGSTFGRLVCSPSGLGGGLKVGSGGFFVLAGAGLVPLTYNSSGGGGLGPVTRAVGLGLGGWLPRTGPGCLPPSSAVLGVCFG